MTRQEAVKWLSNLKMDIGKTQHQELWHYEQALDEIMQALKQELMRGKWIPVTERLPEKGEIVLTTDTLWNGRRVSIDWRNDEQWVRNGQYVIAWQPLPEPYKESDEE